MNRYKVTKQLGDGTYGTVLKAANRQTGEIVSRCEYSVDCIFCVLYSLFIITGIDGH